MSYIVRPDTIANIIASLSQRLFTLETYRSNNPCGRMWGAGGQVITTASDTRVTLGNVSFIQGGMIQNVASSSIFVVPVSGFYTVTGAWICQSAASGQAWAKIFVNGAEVVQQQIPISSTVQTQPMVTDILELNAGDGVALVARQSSGGSITTFSAGTSPFFYYLSLALLSS